MKKIFLILAVLVLIPTGYSYGATVSGGVCTGEVRTNEADAKACADLAEKQGKSLGYTIDCTTEKVDLIFTDPLSNKNYYFNSTCTVNGSTGHGAYLLAGFQASANSNAVIKTINPGWDILKTELEYQSAAGQCGQTRPYYTANGWSCTPPPQPVTPPNAGSSTLANGKFDPYKPLNVGAGQTINGNTDTTSQADLDAIEAQSRAAAQYAKDTVTTGVTGVINSYKASSAYFFKQYAEKIALLNQSNAVSDSVPAPSSCYVFTQTLQNGDTGSDVLALTYVLKHDGLVSENTDVFTVAVMSAVKAFQEAHATDILSFAGLTQGTGVVGPKTRDYLNSNCRAPASIGKGSIIKPISTTPPTQCVNPTKSGKKNGTYTYTYSKNSDGSFMVSVNNKAYSAPGDQFYVPANYSFKVTSAKDLNNQNEGRFNHLDNLPGTPSGNQEYINLFGSFINAYYDWDVMTKDLASVCTQQVDTIDTILPPTPLPGTAGSIVFPVRIRVTSPLLNVRSGPQRSFDLSGTLTLFHGDEFIATGQVQGEEVSGNNLWWVSSKGNYIWSGGTAIAGN